MMPRIWFGALAIVFAGSQILPVFNSMGYVYAAEQSYWDRALERMEQNLVVPPSSYGLTIKDSYFKPDGSLLYGRATGFYTKGGKVHYKVESYLPNSPTLKPYSSSLTVRYEGGEKGATVRAVESVVKKGGDASGHKYSLTRNIESADYPIGEEDPLFFYGNDKKNGDQPDKQPCQAMLNPCLAPLKLTPAQLRACEVKELSTGNNQKAYQVELKKNENVVLIRMFFSPEHGDALVKTEREVRSPSRKGAPGSVELTVRSVEQWAKLADGTYVPARFRMKRSRDGKTEAELVREITNPLIGDVDDKMFDPRRLPEFSRRWNCIVDDKIHLSVQLDPPKEMSAIDGADMPSLPPLMTQPARQTSSAQSITPATIPNTTTRGTSAVSSQLSTSPDRDLTWFYCIAVIFALCVAGIAMRTLLRKKIEGS